MAASRSSPSFPTVPLELDALVLSGHYYLQTGEALELALSMQTIITREITTFVTLWHKSKGRIGRVRWPSWSASATASAWARSYPWCPEFTARYPEVELQLAFSDPGSTSPGRARSCDPTGTGLSATARRTALGAVPIGQNGFQPLPITQPRAGPPHPCACPHDTRHAEPMESNVSFRPLGQLRARSVCTENTT